jgi:hypothetical protein
VLVLPALVLPEALSFFMCFAAAALGTFFVGGKELGQLELNVG